MSVDRHLGCFHVLGIVNSAAVTTGVHVSFQVKVYFFFFFRYMPRSRIVGSYGSSIFSFLKDPPCCFHGLSGGSVVKNPPANAGDPSSIPGSGRSPGGKSGNPLQYSCVANPLDRGKLKVGSGPWVAKE